MSYCLLCGATLYRRVVTVMRRRAAHADYGCRLVDSSARAGRDCNCSDGINFQKLNTFAYKYDII